MYFINVTTTQAGRSSIVQIPIKVGAGAARLEKQGTVQTTPSGERQFRSPQNETPRQAFGRAVVKHPTPVHHPEP